jgi:hypothetical protein
MMIGIGDIAPAFHLRDENGRKVTLPEDDAANRNHLLPRRLVTVLQRAAGQLRQELRAVHYSGRARIRSLSR